MIKELEQFFIAGRRVRFKKIGHFLLLEKKSSFSEDMVDWIQNNLKQNCFRYDKVNQILIYLSNLHIDVCCLMVNADILPSEDFNCLMSYLDRKRPEVVGIVYTNDQETAVKVIKDFPRITTINKVENVCNLMKSLTEEIRDKVVA
jgi:hypothetical protein